MSVGCINLGTSELRLVYDLITDRLFEISDARVPERLTHYMQHHGDKSFRKV